MSAPLASLKILDFTTLLPGPFATWLLADLGAEIIRIEALNRPDLLRFMPPIVGNQSAAHMAINRSKRSLALDLKQPQGAQIVKRLVADYDIVVEQFRPGVMDRLGVGCEHLRAVNPRLIYCSLTGYGQTGPYRDRAGHDLNYLALSGLSAATGRRGELPVPLPVQVADLGGGSLMLVAGLLAAEIYRRETGHGQWLDVSMFDGMLAWNALGIAQTVVSGHPPRQEETELNGGRFYDYYATADGRYLSVAGLEPKFWVTFCEAIGRPDLVRPGLSSDPAEQQDVKQAVQAVIGSQTLEQWMAVFAEHDACVEPVLDTAEALGHPQTVARRMLVDVPRPGDGCQPQVACPLHFSATAPRYRHVGRQLGADTDEILREVGYNDQEIDELRELAIVG